MYQTGFPVHHQQLKTAHAASVICQTLYCYLLLAWTGQQQVAVERLTGINRQKLHLVGCTVL